MPKLNDKQRMFCEEYIGNGFNATAAYRVVYGETPASDRNAHQLKCKPHVQEYIQMRLTEILGPKEELAERLAHKMASIAFAPNESEKIGLQHQLKAGELLGKQLGVYTQKVEMKTDVMEIRLLDDDDNDGS